MMANLAQPGKGGGCTSFPLSLLQMCRVRYSWEGRYTLNHMDEEPPHVKQLSLIHLCKTGLTANTQIHDTLISPICKQSVLNSETMASKAGNSLATCIFRRIIFLGVLSNASHFSVSMWSTVSIKRAQNYAIERIFSVVCQRRSPSSHLNGTL